MKRDSLGRLGRDIAACERCPRLRAHCRQVAREKRTAYRDEDYWGRPVPSFGDPNARILLLGLAPGAHGANRTGRLFTGDSSADFLFAALYRVGLADRPTSRRRDDGLTVRDVWISAAARCAPPGNRPSPEELAECRPYLRRELRLLRRVGTIVALGAVAFAALGRLWREDGVSWPQPQPRFGHGVVVPETEGRPAVIASYHPSRQNTQTGRLTPEMLVEILRLAFVKTEARPGRR